MEYEYTCFCELIKETVGAKLLSMMRRDRWQLQLEYMHIMKGYYKCYDEIK